MSKQMHKIAALGALTLAVALVTAAAQDATTRPTPQQPTTRPRPREPKTGPMRSETPHEAVRSLRVTCVREEGSSGPGSFLQSNTVQRQAAREVPGLTPDIMRDFVRVQVQETPTVSRQRHYLVIDTWLLRIVVQVWIDVPDADAKAEQLVAALCKRLQAEVATRSAAGLQRLREEAAGARAAATQAEQELAVRRARQEKLFAEAGQIMLSRDAILADLGKVEHEQQELEVKLAALHARQNALAEQIARIGREAAQKAATDPVVAELEKIVKLREQKLQGLRELAAREHTVSEHEIVDAEESIALARAEMEKQRQAATQIAGAGLLTDLNKDLVTVTVDIAEAEASRKFLVDRLARARDKNLLALADQYERDVKSQLARAQGDMESERKHMLDSEEQLANYPPAAVQILSGAESDEKSADDPAAPQP